MSTLLDTVVEAVTSTPGLKAKDEALLAEAIVRSAKAGDRGTLEALFAAAMGVPRADQVVSRLADRVLGAVGWRDRRNGKEGSMATRSSFNGYMDRFAVCLTRKDLLGAHTALSNARRVAQSSYPGKWAQDGLVEVATARSLLKKAGWEGDDVAGAWKNPTSETAKLVANTILKQMGGLGRITAMTGAKNVVYGTDEGRDFVSFQFPNKMRAKPNFIKVLYHAGRDTYIVKFARLGKIEVKWGPEYTDIYADSLKPLFERTTGLYLSL